MNKPNKLNLFPCPFCGTQPRLKTGKVKCVNLQCKVQPKIAAWYMQGYEDKAAEDWNTRFNAGVTGLPERSVGKSELTQMLEGNDT